MRIVVIDPNRRAIQNGIILANISDFCYILDG